MIGAVEIEVAFELAEVWKDALPGPAARAARLPFVVILRRAAVGELPIDRRAAAEDARLLIAAQPRPVRRIVMRDDLGRHREVGPQEIRIEIGRSGKAVRMGAGTFSTGVSMPASHNRMRLDERAERRLARTDPAEPLSTMMVSNIVIHFQRPGRSGAAIQLKTTKSTGKNDTRGALTSTPNLFDVTGYTAGRPVRRPGAAAGARPRR